MSRWGDRMGINLNDLGRAGRRHSAPVPPFARPLTFGHAEATQDVFRDKTGVRGPVLQKKHL